MKRPLLCLLAVSSLFNAHAMTHEETVMRTAYAKLAYAVEVGTMHTLVEESNQDIDSAAREKKLAEEAVTFTLTNVRSGNLQDISDLRYSDLVTKPSGNHVLAVAPSQVEYQYSQVKGRMNTASVSWTTEQSLQEDWNFPMSKAIQIAEEQQKDRLSRYAAASVTVRYKGQLRTYNTLWLFGIDSHGKDDVMPIDTVTGNSALQFFATNAVYPSYFTDTPAKSYPVVVDWLKAHQHFESSCQAGQRDACCDLDTEGCGVPANDVSNLIANPKAQSHVKNPAVLQCGSNNFTMVVPPDITSATNLHVWGSHKFNDVVGGYCHYSGGGYNGAPCWTSARMTSTVVPSDIGIVVTSCHVPGVKQANGFSGGLLDQTVSTMGAMAVRTCFACLCSVLVSYPPLSFPQDSIWDQAYNPKVTCPGEYEIIAGSPIIIDAAGAGFQLTSIDNGVKFDLMGDGRRRQVAWTARGTRNAFLALDWDGDGKIDSGKELFGNFTPQPERAEKNGFAALAEYDKPAKGGNGDGIIDEHDAVWPHLRLWIDANHDAIAQTSELFTLPQLGVYSLGLKWSKFPTNDAFGNVFMYSAAVNPNRKDGTSKDGRIAYDVFLRMQP